MNWMTTNQQIAAVRFLAERGWTFHSDSLHPRYDYNNMYGWWVHPELRPRPTGDSTKFYRAAEIAFDLGQYDISGLPSTLEMVYG